MKKCGRFVAGMFGTSLSLAMLSGAFLMANKGAVEAEAAGSYSWNYAGSDLKKFVKNQASFTLNLNGVDWTYTDVGGSGLGYTGTAGNPSGVQLGSSSKKFNGATITTDISNLSSFGNAVEKVSVGTSSQSGKVNLTVKVGDVTLIDNEKTASGQNSAVIESTVLEEPAVGDISIILENNGANYAMLSSISIDMVDYTPVTYDTLEISGTPSKTSYFVGDDFSTEGLVVTASNEAGDSKVVTDDVVWSTDVAEGGLTADDTSVKVTATYNDLTVSKDFEITVAERPVFTTLEATGLEKTSYKAGEKLDTTGLVVTAKTADGSDSYVVPVGEYTIDKTEFTIDDAVTGKATITVSYGELKATFDVNVSAMSVAEFRALNNGQSGIFVGTVTGMFSASSSGGKNLYVHDANGVGLMVYGIYDDTDVSGDIAVGKKVLISASKTVYNGVTEAEDVVKVIVVGEGEVTPIEIKSAEDFTDDKEGSYVKMTGITHKSGSIVDGKYNANVVVTFDGQDFYMSVQNNQGAVDLADAGFDEWIEKIEGLPFDYVGSLGWIDDSYNKIDELGLAPTSMSEFSCPAYDEILDFIKNYMHMNQWVGSAASGDNECLTLFPAAKEALEELSEAQQTYFLKSDNPEIAEAQARYKAWEAAQGDQNAASVIMNTVNENKGTVIAVSAVAALGVAGAVALLISRKKRSAKNK